MRESIKGSFRVTTTVSSVFCIHASSGHALVAFFDFSFVVYWHSAFSVFSVVRIPWDLFCFLPVLAYGLDDTIIYNSDSLSKFGVQAVSEIN